MSGSEAMASSSADGQEEILTPAIQFLADKGALLVGRRADDASRGRAQLREDGRLQLSHEFVVVDAHADEGVGCGFGRERGDGGSGEVDEGLGRARGGGGGEDLPWHGA